MALPTSNSEKRNKRGCYLLAVVIPLFVLLLAAISLGWLGQVDGEKVSDFPIFHNSQ